jgi:probable rRNA maturation factor
VRVSFACGRRGCPPDHLLRRWARAALGRRSPDIELGVRIVGPRESAALNRRWRGRDRPTNVLAFPHVPLPQLPRRPLGDIVICGAVVRREAGEQGKQPYAHWAHMVVHGTLHLLGYDHERRAAARTMEARERRVLRRLAFPDPYA